MTRSHFRFGLAWLLAGLLLLSAGCASSSRSHVTVQEASTITKGKELADLQRAYDEAAINKDEFEQLRRILLKRPN